MLDFGIAVLAIACAVVAVDLVEKPICFVVYRLRGGRMEFNEWVRKWEL